MKKQLKFIVLLLAILFIASPKYAEAANLHAIIVGDTDNWGFWGYSREEIEVVSIHQALTRISNDTALTLQSTLLTGKD